MKKLNSKRYLVWRWLSEPEHAVFLCYFTIAAGIIAWMIWRDSHSPNCTALYGAATTRVMADDLMDCYHSQESGVFETQAIGIALIVVNMVLSWIPGLLLSWLAGWRKDLAMKRWAGGA